MLLLTPGAPSSALLCALPPSPQGQMVAELEKEVGDQLAAKEKELKEAQKQLEGKARQHTGGPGSVCGWIRLDWADGLAHPGMGAG